MKNVLAVIQKQFFEHRAFLVIFVIASFLIFFRLTRADMDTDGAFYSVWGVGYLDYLFSQGQTTPIQWFDAIPWWGNLSFHAHPPVVFLMYHLFFLLFGDSVFTARLPVALAGLGSVTLVYVIAKNLYGKMAGVLSSLFLAVSSYFVWSSRITYLEGIQTFFMLLSVWLFLKALKNDSFYVPFAVAAGMTLLTKYTSWFLIPFFIAYFVLYKKKPLKRFKALWFNKKFYVACAVLIVILSPVVLYNVMMYLTRGHFDVQITRLFSSTFGAAQKDWPILFQTPQGFPSVFKNISSFWASLRRGFSLPFFFLYLISAVFVFIFLFVRRKFSKYLFCALLIFFSFLFFIFTSPEVRYLPIVTPFFAVASGIFIHDIFLRLQKGVFHTAFFGYGFLAVLGSIVLYEVIFNINTNHLHAPFGKEKVWYSDIRIENRGFQNLEQYLLGIWKNDKHYSKSIQRVQNKKDLGITETDLLGNSVYMYENGLNWFSTTWYMKRYYLFHNVNVSSDLDLSNTLSLRDNWFEVFYDKGVKNLYFIKGMSKDVLAGGYDESHEGKFISDFLEKKFQYHLGKAASVKTIYNSAGKEAFLVYHLQLRE